LNTMRILFLIGALGLTLAAHDWISGGDEATFVATATAAAKADPAVLAKACLKCHEDEYPLSGIEVGKLIERTKAIRDGRVAHPPGIKGLSDTQIEAIAAILGKK